MRNTLLVLIMTAITFSSIRAQELIEIGPTEMTEVCEVAETEVIAVSEDNQESMPSGNPYRFKGTDLIAPSLLIGVGIAGLEWKSLKRINRKIEDAVWDGREKQIKVDNFTQFVPALAIYGLNLCGVKGLHDYVDCTIILGTAYLMMAAIVYPTKDFVRSPRPNGTEMNSFPSGHCGWAFAGAEVLRREYWHVSPWIGISGYLIAAGTGFMRLYNGAHWLTDVMAGAGIGILCAEAAYWLYPKIAKTLFPGRYNKNMFLAPYASTDNIGLSLSLSF